RRGYEIAMVPGIPRRALGNPVKAVDTASGERIRCDAVAIAILPAPLHELATSVGAQAHFDGAGFPVETDAEGRTGGPWLFPAGGLRPTWGKGAHPLQPHAALPERVDVVIIGGGIMGLALAWNLAGLRAGRVLVLERGYLCEGASGRNGGGVRAQWTTPTLIELAKESIAFMARFAQELGIN